MEISLLSKNQFPTKVSDFTLYSFFFFDVVLTSLTKHFGSITIKERKREGVTIPGSSGSELKNNWIKPSRRFHCESQNFSRLNHIRRRIPQNGEELNKRQELEMSQKPRYWENPQIAENPN